MSRYLIKIYREILLRIDYEDYGGETTCGVLKNSDDTEDLFVVAVIQNFRGQKFTHIWNAR